VPESAIHCSILVAAMRYSAACCASRQGLDLDCFVRQQIEVFTASKTDVEEDAEEDLIRPGTITMHQQYFGRHPCSIDDIMPPASGFPSPDVTYQQLKRVE
jgi:hypothetical protein